MSRGRKVSPDSFKHQLTFRVTDDVMEWIKLAAKNADVSVTDFIRNAVTKAACSEVKTPVITPAVIEPVEPEFDSFY